MAAQDPAGAAAGTQGRSPVVLAAALVVLVEALAVTAGAAYLAVGSAFGDPDDLTSAWLESGLAALAAVGLLVVAVGLLRVRRWARSPAVVIQILMLPVGIPLVRGGPLAVGAPMTALAGLGLVLLLSPALARVLQDRD